MNVIREIMYDLDNKLSETNDYEVYFDHDDSDTDDIHAVLYNVFAQPLHHKQDVKFNFRAK